MKEKTKTEKELDSATKIEKELDSAIEKSSKELAEKLGISPSDAIVMTKYNSDTDLIQKGLKIAQYGLNIMLMVIIAIGIKYNLKVETLLSAIIVMLSKLVINNMKDIVDLKFYVILNEKRIEKNRKDIKNKEQD